MTGGAGRPASISAPLVTIVVTVRERHSTALRCLPDLIAKTPMPHRLVYVAGGAPAYVADFLTATCAAHGYELELGPRFLPPNEARNLGLRRVTTRYAAFLDNDVVVEPGWLEALVGCAEATGADVVGPLCLYGEPEHGLVHTAGGDLAWSEAGGRRSIVEEHRHARVNLQTAPLELVRSRCDFVEFHCLLARRDLFDRIGPLDERIISSAEHIDLALTVRDHGGTIFAEPAAVVSYLPDADHVLSDAPSFQRRWSDDWFAPTMAHFARKWRLDPASAFFRDYAGFHRLQGELCRLPRVPVPPPADVTAHRHGFAQTRPQLAAQLRRLGHPRWDIETVLRGYETAAAVFEGLYAPSGKTFIAHAVGTASVLAAFGAPVTVIVAGLLYAAYSLGRFPGPVEGSLPGARRWLSLRLGHRAEAQVFEDFRLDFTRARAAVLESDTDRLPLRLAYAVLTRIASAVEPYLDAGVLHVRSPRATLAKIADQHERWWAVYRRVATLLGCDRMLALLGTLHAEVTRGTLDDVPFPAPVELDYVIDAHSRQAVPRVAARPPDETPDVPSADRRPLRERLRPDLGPILRTFDTSALEACNGGVVRRGPPDLVTLVTDPHAWSYSGLLTIDPDEALRGAAILKVTLTVSSGRLGVAVLWRGSSTEFLGAEQSVEAGHKVELLFVLPEVREAGRLVFRGCVPGPTCVHLSQIALHAAAAPRTEPRDAGPGHPATAAPHGVDEPRTSEAHREAPV